MRRRTALAVSLVPLLLGLADAQAAAAGLVYTAQDRSADAASTSIGDLWEVGTNPFFPDFDGPSLSQTANASDTEAASDFAPFSASVNVPSPGLPFVSSVGAASASQTSVLGGNGISASGSFDATRDAHTIDAATLALISMFLPATYNFGIARDSQTAGSSFQTTFNVSEEAVYRVSATLSVSAVGGIFPGDTLSEASLELRQVPGAALVGLSIDQNDFCSTTCEAGSASIDQLVTLVPGSYELTAFASGAATGTCADIGGGLTCATSPTFASFDVQLIAPDGVPALGTGAHILLALLLGLGSLGWSQEGSSGVRRNSMKNRTGPTGSTW